MHPFKALFLTVLLGACISVPAWAQPVVIGAGPAPGNSFFIYHSTGGGFPPMPPMIIPPLLAGMNAAQLTSDQQTQLNQILKSNASQTASLIQQLQSIHEQIADRLLSPGTVSIEDLTPLENKAAQLDAQIQQLALNASVQIRAILTPDQVSRMAQFHQKMAALQAQMKNLMQEAASQPDPAPR